MKSTVSELKKALSLLEIPEQASILEINKIYKNLLFQWHPDRGLENKKVCNEKTQQIIKSYKLIMSYCEKYRYSFSDDDIEKNLGDTDPVKFWFDKFGEDPIWG
jgi:DnaJ-class molecular chaperone